MQVELKRIRLDGGTQPRAAIYDDVVEDYAERMQAGAIFPPVTVFFDGCDYWLADGFHRVHAALKLSEQGTIEAEVFQGTQADTQWYSFGVNKTHGARRTNDDKIRAVRAALSHPHSRDLSDAAIAEHVGVCRETVLRHRRQESDRQPAESGPSNDLLLSHKSTGRIGRDGRTIDTSRIGCNSKTKPKPGEISPKAFTPQRGHSPPCPMVPLQFSPNNPQTAAATLVREFSRAFIESLVQELSRYLTEGDVT